MVDLRGLRARDVWLEDVDITGDVENVRINGVDVAPLIEAELDRRDPDRPKMRPTDAAGYREAWDVVERLWAGTVDARPHLPARPAARAGRRGVVVHRDAAPPRLRHRRLGVPRAPR